MYIECTKGFLLGDGDGKQHDYQDGFVMVGEIFKTDSNGDGTDFIGVNGGNRCPGVEISFTPYELISNFKLIHQTYNIF